MQLRHGADLTHLAELDQKLWMALAMPTRGVEFDPRTAALLDTDKDGRIRPPEVLAAIAWASTAFKSLDPLFKGGDEVPLANIADADLLACAKRTLTSLQKADAAAITLADVSSTERIFATTVLNGDGIITPESASLPETRRAIEDLLSVVGPVTDRSGKPGIDLERIDAFFKEAEEYEAWARRGETELAVFPAGEAGTLAVEATSAVQAKLEDYFARCRMAAFDPRAGAALNHEEKDFAALGQHDLTLTSPELLALPLSHVEAARALPLDGGGVNPAWASALAAFRKKVVEPLLGARSTLSEGDWDALRAKLVAPQAWQAARPAARVEKLGLPRLRELLGSDARTQLATLVASDRALEKEFAQLEALERLVRYQRDLVKLVTNFVNFADFYGRKGSVFQVGTLYLDARSCELCIDVADPAKHATLASLSAAYIAYCEVTRPGETARSIGAIFTNGDSTNLMVGRNGVFYDRQGRDWDATITKIVSNPISIREAFWLPYQKLIRLIDQQITKRAQAADTHADGLVTATAGSVATVDQKPPVAKPAEAKKLDLGTIALVGTAIGGMSALVGGFLSALFGLGLWMPLGVVGVLMLISGPSMLLAYLKLRQRNLGPLLDANGWAINTRARLNVPLGAVLTRLAKTPYGSVMAPDPFAQRKRPWKTYLALLVVVALGYAWLVGRLDGYLPAAARSTAVLPPALAPAPAPAASAK